MVIRGQLFSSVMRVSGQRGVDNMVNKQKGRRDAAFKPRNWVARSLVMHKAAVHGKSKGAQRKAARESLRKDLSATDG